VSGAWGYAPGGVRTRRILGTSAALLLALAVAVPSARAATAQQTIDELNTQRAANGIPAGITENPAWSQDCSEHDSYMALNNTLTSTEVSGSPGYSAEGAFAGQNSVLAQGATWDNGNPYESAPLHLDQLLAPRLETLGSADAEDYSCTTTFPGWTRPAPAAMTIYTYPGNGASIYPAEVADESPFTPGTLVGMPPGEKTGPVLIVLADPPAASVQCLSVTLSAATLTGPSGFVPLVTVDDTTPIHGGDTLACYISPGGFLIPRRPLKPGVAYRAHVMVTYGASTIAHDWSFTTTGMDPHATLTLHGHRLRFASSSPAPLRVTFTRTTGAHAPATKLAPGKSIRLQLPPGSWQACGREPPAHGYSAFAQCVSFAVKGVPKLQFGRPRPAGQNLRFPLGFTPVLRGRSATLTITPETCTRRSCTPDPTDVVTQTIVLGAPSVVVPLPAPGTGVRLTVSTAAFQLGDAPWVAAQATSRLFISR
jgi:hypothetical protein